MNRNHLKKIISHYTKADPFLLPYLKKVKFDDWLPSIDKQYEELEYFKALARSIVYQQLSGKAAATIYGRFEALFPYKSIVPHLLLEFRDEELRGVGLSRAKTSYVKDLAQKYLNREINFKNIEDLSDEAIALELIKVKGIGQWTAEMFLIFTLGRENIFSYGDLGLKKGLEKIYNIDSKNQDAISKIVEKWSPFKTYGTITLWHVLE